LRKIWKLVTIARMSYGELPTDELKVLSQREARHLSLPLDQLTERNLIHGTAVEEAGTTSINQAVSLADEEGRKVLRFSAPDLASVLTADKIVVARALRLGYSVLDDEGAVLSNMLPRILSNELFSLLEGETKPALTIHMPLGRFGEVEVDDVTFTRDLVRTKVLTPRRVHVAWEQERGEGPLSRLEEVASNLYRMRSKHEGDEVELTNGFYLETETGEALSHPYPVGLFIIQEARFAVNAAMGAFLYRHDIPAIYANHVVPMDDEARAAENPGQALELARLRYSAIPQGHLSLGRSARQPYAHVTDPLNSYDGLLNTMNLVNYPTGHDYPFDILAAKYGARRLNMLQDGEEKARERIIRSRSSQGLPAATELLQKLESNDEMHAGELGTALFGEVNGDDDVVAALRQQAATFLAANINLSRQVWQMALARGWIKVKSIPLEGGEVDTVAINASGEGFSFEFEGSSKARSVQAAVVIGQLVNHEIELAEPVIETKNELSPYAFLESLAAARKIHLKRTTLRKNKETGEATVRVTVSLWDGSYPCEATGPSVNAADREAARALIEQVKLTEDATFIPNMEELGNPITLLHNHCARRGVNPPVYTFTPKKGKFVICKVEFVDVSGKPRVATGKASGEQQAKGAAAQAAIAKLPPPPPKKKKKRPVVSPDTTPTQ
jgi:hypothetical protein